MSQIVPGWYPDPVASTTDLRWWDGEKWTEHTHPVPQPEVRADYTQPMVASPPAQPTPAPAPSYPEAPAYPQSATHPQTNQPYGAPATTPSPYGQPATQQTYAPYGPLSGRMVTHDGQELAGWGSRFVAKVIDWFLVTIVTAVIGIQQVQVIMSQFGDMFAAAMEAAEQGAAAPDSAEFAASITSESLILSLIGLAVGLVYRFGMLKGRQATLGKMALGIKVRHIDADGPLSAATIGKRLFGEYWVFPLGLVPFLGFIGTIYRLLNYLWPLWDGNRMALHDRFARTQVVKSRP